MTSMPEKLLTVAEVADLLGVPVSTVYQWNSRGGGPPATKVGRFVRWRPSCIDRWVEEHSAAAR
jgi:excisionase family DNA binding protein